MECGKPEKANLSPSIYKGLLAKPKLKIFIPINKQDLITVDNLNDTSTPVMYTDDLDLPYKTNLKKYDKSKFTQVRILTDFNWLKEAEKDENYVYHVKAIYIDAHGGGFVTGSSHDQCK
mmetsp:Transcript_25693/g.29544  ORF Transcript_25693/g.29544 Transcript_25693/m.29544 type:complete len:119 (+) Transcript_25693:1093-1449(+)